MRENVQRKDRIDEGKSYSESKEKKEIDDVQRKEKQMYKGRKINEGNSNGKTRVIKRKIGIGESTRK